MQEHLFEPILEIVIETMPRDNLLNSACLEFFEYIKRENIKVLISHIVENYREKLQQINYVDTFREIILKYEYFQNPPPSFTTQSTLTPAPEEPNARRSQWQGNARDLDAAEEEYFNVSDNEDEEEVISRKPAALKNGSSPATKPLVDYNSDEDTDLLAADKESQKDSSTKFTPLKADLSNENATTTPRSSTPARPPPERLSEKRRREEDEEDELSKLSQNKRRSSTSSNGSNGSIGGGLLRRKKNFTPARDSSNGAGGTATATGNGVKAAAKEGGGPKKIAISLLPATTTITSGGEGNDASGS